MSPDEAYQPEPAFSGAFTFFVDSSGHPRHAGLTGGTERFNRSCSAPR